jgi:hypothetical protein
VNEWGACGGLNYWIIGRLNDYRWVWSVRYNGSIAVFVGEEDGGRRRSVEKSCPFDLVRYVEKLDPPFRSRSHLARSSAECVCHPRANLEFVGALAFILLFHRLDAPDRQFLEPVYPQLRGETLGF